MVCRRGKITLRKVVLIFTAQHDHPVPSILTGIQRYRVHRKVRLRDILTGVLSATAVRVDHCCPVVVDCHTYLNKPVLSADLT